MKKNNSMYEELGIDPHKAGVREIFQALFPKGQHPNAFCIITPDPLIKGNVRVKHPDGSGSKTVQRVLHFLETRDVSIFSDDVSDFVSMNTSDIAACGFVYNIELTDVIDINSLLLPKDAILKEFAIGFAEIVYLYKKHGIQLDVLGGETADLPDQVTTIVSNADTRSSMPETFLISGDVEPGDTIYGFSSAGQAVWENELNSGIMANGLTMARKVLMHQKYSTFYPFLCHPDKPFRGRYCVDDRIDELGMVTVSEALLSPTRQWAILIRMLMDKLDSINADHLIHGICINTGGGLTKVLNLGQAIRYIKSIPTPPSVFKLIQNESGETWNNMFTSFNCGIGIEIIGDDEDGILSKTIQEISEITKIESFVLGKCQRSSSEKNEVVIDSEYGKFPIYTK
jgi:phosphoribosylformylglycinamidine cyclo-ligase